MDLGRLADFSYVCWYQQLLGVKLQLTLSDDDEVGP